MKCLIQTIYVRIKGKFKVKNMEEKEVTQEVEQPVVEQVQDDNGNTPITLDQYRKFMSLLCYLSGLVFIPLICMFRDPVVRKHASNDLFLLIIEVVLFIIAEIFSIIEFPIGIIIIYVLLLFPAVFAIIGIVYVAKDMRKEVPLIGKIKILK